MIRSLLQVSMIFMFLVLASAAHASYLYIEINDGEVEEVIPFTYNLYYQQKFYFGAEGDSPGSDGRLDGNKITIETESTFEYHIIGGIDFSEDYEITIDGTTERVSFCNNDGECQPCFEGLCNNIENHLTCPEDCPSGGEDNYCDLKRDGVCDPDCKEYDFDCDECMDNICIYDGMEVQSLICSDMDGSVCAHDEDCHGFFTYSDDAGMRCCIGECGIPEQADGDQQIEERESPQHPSAFVESEDEDDLTIYVIAMVVFMVAAISIAVFAQAKSMKVEQQMRQYVSDMTASGYGIDQIESALLQQGYDKDSVDKVCKHYRK